MVDTSMYKTQGGGMQSGLRMGQQIGSALGGMFNDPLKIAMEKIKAGESKEAIIAEMQQRDPAMAQKLIELLGGSDQSMMGVV